MDYLLMLFLAFLGIICPIFNTEVSFLAMSYKVGNLVLLAAAAAVGSTAGFMVFYAVGAGSRNLSARLKSKVEAINVDKFRKSGLLVLSSSALASVPPCTPLSIAAGTLRYDPVKFAGVFVPVRMLKYWIIGCFYDQIHGLLLRVLHELESLSGPILQFLERTI